MKTLLFDLDDTILSYDAAAEEAWHEACETFISHFSLSVDQLREAILQTSRWYWADPKRHREGRLNLKKARREVVKKTLDDLNLNAKHVHNVNEEIGNGMADFFSKRREELVKPFPGAIETLQEFTKRGQDLGLLTNGAAETQRHKIERFKLDPYFKIILVEGELGFGKPDARVFKKALAHFGAEAKETWMIGDHLEWDVAGAQALGITGIWNDWEKKGLPKDSKIKPDRIISTITELL